MLTPAAASLAGTGPPPPPPASSIGQRCGRHGPSPAPASQGPGSQRASGAIAAGRTTTPSSRTGFISTTSVGAPRPSPLSSACAWSATPGPTGPCQVTRTALSSGEVAASTDRALWSPAIWACAATPAANAAASAMPSAGSSQRKGRRRPRAAASISGADKPLGTSPLCPQAGAHGQGGFRGASQ